jgi:hypothetical protein
MTRSEYAKHRGVSKPAVTQWAAAGRIVTDESGDVVVEESDKRLAATINTRGGKRPRTDLQAAPQTAPSEPVSTDAPTQGALMLQPGSSLTQARTAQAQSRARLDELDYVERVGILVERARYDQALADGLGPILSQLDSVASRIAPALVGQTDVRRVIDIIDAEIINLRQEIADKLRSLAIVAGATKQ